MKLSVGDEILANILPASAAKWSRHWSNIQMARARVPRQKIYYPKFPYIYFHFILKENKQDGEEKEGNEVKDKNKGEIQRIRKEKMGRDRGRWKTWNLNQRQEYYFKKN